MVYGISPPPPSFPSTFPHKKQLQCNVYVYSKHIKEQKKKQDKRKIEQLTKSYLEINSLYEMTNK